MAMKLGDNKLVASPSHGANIAAFALAGLAWVWRGTANLALRTLSKTQGAGPMKTFAAATVVVVALTCGTAATAHRMADAYKTCEHLMGFPTCYGACTLWYTSDEPWENEELVKRSETCYAKDRGWEGFRPPEEVVVTGTRRRITIIVTIRGTTDGDTDPVEDVVGGGGSGSGGSRDGQTNQPADNPPQCPATETEGINAPENCVCPQGHVKVEGRTDNTYRYCKAPYTPPPGGIDSTIDAVRHYYQGNGATVEVSDSVKDTIEAVSEVREALRGLAAGTADRGALHEPVKLRTRDKINSIIEAF